MIPKLEKTTAPTKILYPVQYEVLMDIDGSWCECSGKSFYAEMDKVVELPRGGRDNYRYFIGWSGDTVNIQRVLKTTEWK